MAFGDEAVKRVHAACYRGAMRERDASRAVSRAKDELSASRAALSDRDLAARAVALAGALLEAAEHEKRADERERAALLAGLMQDPAGQALTTLLTDRVYRSRDPARAVDAARQLLRALGVPKYLPAVGRLQLRALLHAGPFAPAAAARGMYEKLRSETAHVVLPAEDPELARFLAQRRDEGVRVNVNRLGEVVLGEAEAEARIEGYVALLARPDVEAISIKISSIDSQLDLLAWDATLDRLSERLRAVYRAALAHRVPGASGGGGRPKLVNLDMESYRDLRLTLAVFQRVLDEPEFAELGAGMVLQAYLPDSAALQRELTAWAIARVARGAAPIRLRVVKGANLLTERVESASRGWDVPIYPSKAEVDANYKRMIEYGCRAEHARAVRLGVASHNVFDIALGMIWRAQQGSEADVSFELLEGMAPHVLRAVRAVAGDTLVYAPVVERESMQSAIAYLMRRLDENTAPENFLHHSFDMRAGDAAFEAQRAQFERALSGRGAVGDAPRRTQDRSRAATDAALPAEAPFENEPDTDFALAHNRQWLASILTRWRERETFEVPLQIAGALRAGAPHLPGFDPSRPERVPYRFAVAAEADVEAALDCAVRAAERTRATPLPARAEMLAAVAQQLRRERGELIAAMVLDAGKRVEQADAEVSEAIDFAEYYARSYRALVDSVPELGWQARGVVLVTPPWNFPLAIPAGGVFAALMAGNAVILKPALETVLVAERLAQACWDAGVPRDALQLVVCTDDVGSALIRDRRVDHVVLTGATSTARLFHELRPGISLAAETGGKNAIVVSAMSDRDDAIKDAVASAFGHAGQKCSACSLLICEAEVYDDPAFRATLADAARSLPCGSAWDATSVVTPLIAPPNERLLRALTALDDGESWLLEPRRDPRNPRLWSPGIKLGVREGSFTHTTELFGPVLAVMRADDLDHALRIANATPYGLTAGFYGLDEQEQARWAEQMQAGNLYVNRPITGAIVRRQPFGGYKRSAFGPGAKAGGPNYVAHLARPVQQAAPAIVRPPEPEAAALIARVRDRLDEGQRSRLGLGACSYAQALHAHFAVDHDPSAVLGERNVFRYRPCRPMLLRASADAAPCDSLLACVAALTARARFVLSVHPALAARLPASLPGVELAVEDAAACAARIGGALARVRAVGGVEPDVLAAAERAMVHVADEPVLLSGRVELLAYHLEQSLSQRYHRYGNLAGERLLPPLREGVAAGAATSA
jgi:RHH-type proline utilization regulon transcriptional repressor/proline dehydrogenase/delta 1-pyrroline-5-carboxylate dehydrogenase